MGLSRVGGRSPLLSPVKRLAMANLHRRYACDLHAKTREYIPPPLRYWLLGMEQGMSGPPVAEGDEPDALRHADSPEPEKTSDPPTSAFAIVGIGASAG